MTQMHTHPIARWRFVPRLSSLRRAFILVFSVAAIFTILTAGAAIAQSSANFGLACQTNMNAGGGTILSGNFRSTVALGQPFTLPAGNSPTYAIRSANYALRTGFLPGYPAGSSAISSVATADAGAPSLIEQGNFTSLMPIVYKAAAALLGGC